MPAPTRKTWADQQGIRTGVIGEALVEGGRHITICEKNRATTYERFREGIQELQSYLQRNYRSKGVGAILFGIESSTSSPSYAIFVEDGFLKEVE